MMHPVRAHLIAEGILRPLENAGDPSPIGWIDRPTLRLDRAGAKRIRHELENTRAMGRA